MKIIAYYLPQFHRIPENDELWGEGFTEWTNVKGAEALFEGHNQPRVPKDDRYYDLLSRDVKEWQVALAKQYGIYGFCMYHYWFGGRMLLEKPVEQYLADKSLDFPFCICWANENWTDAWVSERNTVLIEQRYGGREEWKAHFEYLLPFFQDDRYIKVDGKPLFVLYRPELIPNVNEMLDYWQQLACQAEIGRLAIAYQKTDKSELHKRDDSRFDFNIEYQPAFAEKWQERMSHKILRRIKQRTCLALDGLFHTSRFSSIRYEPRLEKRDYIDYWETIIQHEPKDRKCIPGAFVDWDNTPRKGIRGSVFENVSPEAFYYYMKKQIIHAREQYQKDMIFIFAWNEWGEGGYLEPDMHNDTRMLEGIKRALMECDEFPW